jgi:hypothetical protein
MSRWFPSKTNIQKWIEDQEKEFDETQNKNPNEWLARLVDTQFKI